MRIVAVGDISLGDSPKNLGLGVKSKVAEMGINFLFERIKSRLRADIVFANLEVTLSEKGLVRFDFCSEQLRGAPEMVEGLKHAGINVVSIANNHAMQHGADTFEETAELLEREGIGLVGLRGQGEFCSYPYIKCVGDKRVGFLGYTFEKDVYLGEEELLYAHYGSKQNIVSDIQKIRDEVDVLILSLHWGLEYMDRPSITTMSLARELVDAGTDIILGHHPHVVQGIERYKKGVICYSLGNFVFDMAWNRLCQLGMIVELVLKANDDIEYNVIPIEINAEFQPEEAREKVMLEFYEYFNNAVSKMEKEMKGDPEKNNLRYYLDYERVRKREAMRANLFLLKTLPKTPPALIPGKLNDILKKLL